MTESQRLHLIAAAVSLRGLDQIAAEIREAAIRVHRMERTLDEIVAEAQEQDKIDVTAAQVAASGADNVVVIGPWWTRSGA